MQRCKTRAVGINGKYGAAGLIVRHTQIVIRATLRCCSIQRVAGQHDAGVGKLAGTDATETI